MLRCCCRFRIYRSRIVFDLAAAAVDDDAAATLALWDTVAGSSKVENLF
jgi:hypothetical protein